MALAWQEPYGGARMASPWIRTPDELDDLVDALAGTRAIGLDTEADSLHHYVEKVCLIQLSAFDGRAWLIDPLALDDLSPLAPILADPSVVKVLHGGDNDITSMRRDFDVSFRTLFDTALAARLLGDTELGLQALVRNELGVELTKGSQRDDWSKRPLTPKQEAYALADVEHLMALATRMTDRLDAAGRIEWAREEFAALAALPPSVKRSGPEEFRRIKGSSKLSPRKQAVLRELHVWREELAAAADVPPFRIVDAEVLLALAGELPESADDVARLLARYPRARHQADAAFDAIERGLDLPDDDLPARERGERKPSNPSAKRRVEALRTWRTEQAEQSRLDPAIVLPQRLIERIAAAGPQTLDDLVAIDGVRRWRVAAWGEAMLAACA